MSKVPDSIRRQLLNEQEKRNQRTPTLRLTGLTGYTAHDVQAIVNEIPGVEPFCRVTPQGDHFIVKTPDGPSAEAVMIMNGCRLTDGQHPKFQRVKVKITMELKTQERSSNISKADGP